MKALVEAARAAAVAKSDGRCFLIGAAARRSDGALVTAANGPSQGKCPQVHAEARLARKLDIGATVVVVRVRRGDGTFALARPCAACANVLRSKAAKVYYTDSLGDICQGWK